MRGGRELEVAVQMAVGDALVEGVHELLDFEARDAALDLHARHQPQRHGGHHAKQAIAADHVPE